MSFKRNYGAEAHSRQALKSATPSRTPAQKLEQGVSLTT